MHSAKIFIFSRTQFFFPRFTIKFKKCIFTNELYGGKDKLKEWIEEKKKPRYINNIYIHTEGPREWGEKRRKKFMKWKRVGATLIETLEKNKKNGDGFMFRLYYYVQNDPKQTQTIKSGWIDVKYLNIL